MLVFLAISYLQNIPILPLGRLAREMPRPYYQIKKTLLGQ